MALLNRGEVPFVAAGREMFLAYGTREIAEAQAALGFRRPDPFEPDVAQEVDVPVVEGGQQKLDPQGLPVFRRMRVLVDARERQRRMLQAFDAVVLNPDPEATLILFRIGLRRWERERGAKLTEEAFQQTIAALGFLRMNTLHFQAVSFGSYLDGDEPEADEGKAEGAATVSST